MNIILTPMTPELAQTFFKEFVNDPTVFMDNQEFVSYVYSPERVDAYCKKQQALNRIHLAIMRGNQPVGEILFKNLNSSKRSCTFSIHLQNDSVKGQGIGTTAERLVVTYAFTELNMKMIYADALKKNKRSCHVLEKAGFQKVSEDETFCYYQCNASTND